MDLQPNVGEDLVRIHKVITRALQVGLENCRAEALPEPLRPGYRAYLRALAILLHAHHNGEDELAFPFWKRKLPAGPFDELIDQHQQMLPALTRIEGFFLGEAWQPGDLDGLQGDLADLQRLWLAHIALEEATVGVAASARYLTPEENGQLARQLSEHGQANSQPGELVMPFIVYNLPVADREVFIRLLPPVVVEQLIPFAWKPAWEPMIPFLNLE